MVTNALKEIFSILVAAVFVYGFCVLSMLIVLTIQPEDPKNYSLLIFTSRVWLPTIALAVLLVNVSGFFTKKLTQYKGPK